MNITGEESQAELEAMLEKYEETDIEDTEDTEDTEDEAPETRDDEASEDKASAEKQPDPQPEDDDADHQQILLAKDGKNIIPYQVLESERAEKNHAYQQLADLKSQLEQAQYRQQMLEEQINHAGMTPLDSPEKLQLTPEKLQTLREEMPDVADVVETLAGKTRHLEHLYQQQLEHLRQLQQQREQPRQYEAQVALQENQTLTDWRDNDPERFRFACQVDNMMENDPQWSSKPMADRFAEVTRRTLAAFGDPLPDTATAQKLVSISQQKVQQALNSDALPDSPSQLGTPVSAPQNLNDRIASASGDELQDIIGKMSSQQIEDMLAGL